MNPAFGALLSPPFGEAFLEKTVAAIKAQIVSDATLIPATLTATASSALTCVNETPPSLPSDAREQTASRTVNTS